MLSLAVLSQVFILDSLATYQAVDEKEAEKITERVAPRLQHANCAVVLSAVKVRPAACCCCWRSCLWGCAWHLQREPVSEGGESAVRAEGMPGFTWGVQKGQQHCMAE